MSKRLFVETVYVKRKISQEQREADRIACLDEASNSHARYGRWLTPGEVAKRAKG